MQDSYYFDIDLLLIMYNVMLMNIVGDAVSNTSTLINHHGASRTITYH